MSCEARKKGILMEITCNDWSVTVYATRDDDIPRLMIALERARKEGVSCGSVGIVPLPAYCEYVSMEEVYRYIWFPHRTFTDVQSLCGRAGVSLEGVSVERIVVGQE